jgi:nitrate reductase NapD
MTTTPSRRDLLRGYPGPAGAARSAGLHVTGVVVHARPEALPGVTGALAGMPGVEVHGSSPVGKVVVTLEGEAEQDIVDRLGLIGELPGVLSAALVYHHFE